MKPLWLTQIFCTVSIKRVLMHELQIRLVNGVDCVETHPVETGASFASLFAFSA